LSALDPSSAVHLRSPSRISSDAVWPRLLTRRSPRRLFTAAARADLQPDSAIRLREADSHLKHSFALHTAQPRILLYSRQKNPRLRTREYARTPPRLGGLKITPTQHTPELRALFGPADRIRMEPTSTATERKTAKRDSERRRTPRVPHVVEAWLWSPTAKDQKGRMEAVAINLSRNGVGFCVKRPLPTGAFFVIQIGLGNQQLLSEVRILTCRPLPEGQHEVGAEFC
jgi:PilZ domain